MFCTKCGTYCADDDRFCNNCGAKLTAPEAPAVVSPETPISAGPISAPPITKSEPQDESAVAILTEKASDIQEPTVADTEVIQESTAESQVQEPDPVVTPVTIPPVVPAAEPTVPESVISPVDTPMKQRPKSSVGAKLLSVFLSILLVVFSIGGMLSFDVRRCLSEDIVRDAVEDFDLLNLPVNGDHTLLDVIQDGALEAGYEISKKEIQDALEDSSVHEALSTIITDIGEYLTGEKTNFVVRAEDIIDLIQENAEAIYDATGIDLSDADLAVIEDYLAREGSVLEDFSSDILIDVPGIDLIRNSFSLVAMIAMGVIVVVLIVVLFLINKRRYAAFAYSGISLLIGGICVAMVALLYRTLTAVVSASSVMMFFTDNFQKLIRTTFGLTGLTAIAVGIVLIVIYALCANASKRKYRRLEEAAAMPQNM